MGFSGAMGCAASQAPQPNQKEPEKDKNTKTDGRPDVLEADPKYAEIISSFAPVFAQLAKEKAAFVSIVPNGANLEAVIVVSSGEVYSELFTEVALRERRGEKTSWSAFFKQLRHQLKKAVFKCLPSAAKLGIPSDGKATGAIELPLRFEGANFAGAHRLLLTPMGAAFAKFKAADDSKFSKLEADSNAVKAATAESSQRIHALQAEIEPLSKSARQAQDDARAAREQCDGVRNAINKLRNALECKGQDFLYPDGPAIYTLHLPQSKEHRPNRRPGNERVMAHIRTTYGGDPAILTAGNASNPDQILKILEKVDDWDFDVFALTEATNGTPLFTTCYHLLYKYGLVQYFNIDHTVLCNFLQALESGYHANPYHNNTHAADVVQMTHYVLDPNHGNLKTVIGMTENDLFASLLAAAMHDFDHPGFNNNFHIRTTSYLATLYNDRSILENHHCTCIFDLVKNPKFNVFASMNWEQYKDIRDTVLEMVLSTDMGVHARIYQTFRRRLNEGKEWAGREEMRLAMSVAIKMADISNCCRPRHIYQEWAKGIAAEFYNQGDAEARLGLPISPFMDRRYAKTDFPKGQISFMNYIVIPLFEAGATLLPTMSLAVEFAKKNKQDLLSGNLV